MGAWWRGARRGARCRHAVFCPRRLGRGRSRELRPCPPTGCVAALAQGSRSVGRVRGGSHPAVRLSRARALGLAWASRLRRERRYLAGVRTDPCTQTRTHGGDRTRGGQVGMLAAGSHVRGALPALPGDGRLAWPRRALWAAPQHPSLRPGPSRRPSGRSGQPRASPSTPGRWPCPDRCPGLAQRVAPGRPPPPRGLRLARLGPRRRSGAFEDIACDEIFLRFRL